MSLLHLESICIAKDSEIETYYHYSVDCGVSSPMIWDVMKAVIRGKLMAISSTYRREKQYQLEQDKNISLPWFEYLKVSHLVTQLKLESASSKPLTFFGKVFRLQFYTYQRSDIIIV